MNTLHVDSTACLQHGQILSELDALRVVACSSHKHTWPQGMRITHALFSRQKLHNGALGTAVTGVTFTCEVDDDLDIALPAGLLDEVVPEEYGTAFLSALVRGTGSGGMAGTDDDTAWEALDCTPEATAAAILREAVAGAGALRRVLCACDWAARFLCSMAWVRPQ